MFILSQLKKIFIRNPKIIVVLGQTSTGKSDLAVEIAQQYNGEIISADSRQVYKGMDLGSGKITTEEMQGVPHYLLDVADPKTAFDVQQFQKLGTLAIQKILKNKKTPIICGGTGFYIDSLIYQTKFSSVGPNQKLRKELKNKSTENLAEMLINISPKDAEKVDLQNPIRIIRAIEIIKEIGYIPKIEKKNLYDIFFIGLTIPKDELDKRIYSRITTRLNLGMLDEAHTLLKKGVTHERLQSLGLEYKFMGKHILDEITYQEMIDQLYRSTVQFAKRQKTWFKRNKNIHWFNSFEDRSSMFLGIKKFLGK